jgi:hypothetical protein
MAPPNLRGGFLRKADVSIDLKAATPPLLGADIIVKAFEFKVPSQSIRGIQP